MIRRLPITITHLCYRALFAIYFMLIGCEQATGPDKVLPRLELTAQQLQLAESADRFGLKLFREIVRQEPDKNIFISPLSVSMALGMMTMSGMILPMVIPDEDARKVVGKIIGIIGKLAPVAAKIDFYKSTVAYMTFDGKAWHARQVTHYQSPAERSADATP